MHIQPGAANAERVESFNGRLRDECLNANWFATMSEAKRKIEAWREEYNRERPHSSLGYRTPEEFARAAALWDAPSGAGQRPQEVSAVCRSLLARMREKVMSGTAHK